MARTTAPAYTDNAVFERLHPCVTTWFERTFKTFTPPQLHAIVPIIDRKNILVCAPTGSGKTLSCFIGIIDHLCQLAEQKKLEDRVYCLYISPLRALGNDIHRNLEVPLAAIGETAAELGYDFTPIRIGTRTGDTPQNERQKMLKKPPHILITTPESAAILLNAPKFKAHLEQLDYVVVDEVHELADSKRGAHLSITLERLQHSCVREFTRVGMSATMAPLKDVARFLVGYRANEKPRPCLIADVSYAKKTDIRVISPLDDLLDEGATPALYKTLQGLVDEHNSTLIFTNTRSGAESISYHLSEHYGDDGARIGTHHGSLSRDVRLEVEENLKKGLLKAVVASSSLELGIDIGDLDLSVLVGSPKSVTRLIQRVGRAGHQIEKKAKGRVVVIDKDDLVEAAVLAKCAGDKTLDSVQIVGAALDVLAQQLVGMALEKRWDLDEALGVIRQAYPYHDITREQLDSELAYLSGSALEERRVYPKLWLSEDGKTFDRRGGSTRMIYMTHVGTIASDSALAVFEGSKRIGKIDEPFLERLHKGDVFVLGGKSYVFKSVSGSRVSVDDARGRNPTIPSWIGEMLPLSFDSAIEIGKFRGALAARIKKEDRQQTLQWLETTYYLDDRAAQQIYDYVSAQYRYTKTMPTNRRIVIEEFFDETEHQNLVFHALYGRRTLDALSRAYAFHVGKIYSCNVAVTISDNGFVLRLPRRKKANTDDLPALLKSDELEALLTRILRQTEMLKRRFRHCAVRGLMVLRSYKGKDILAGRQQRSAEFILHAAEKIPNFPILEEANREILEEVFDIHHAIEIVRGIESGKIAVQCVHVDIPSPFAHNLIALQAADVVLMESRKELLKDMHRRVLEAIADEQKSTAQNA